MKTNEQIIKEAIDNRNQALYDQMIEVREERESKIMQIFPDIVSLGNNTYTLAGYTFFGCGSGWLKDADSLDEIFSMDSFATWVERKLRQEEEDNKPKPLSFFQKLKHFFFVD